ncbi:sialate O-acetylesterase [Flavobacterium cellulosilyticum]|uniref:Sialate O-acetylesterase n=1 Tax=Flavobacterium cellulosilyticum TaxID=2541731 RepID=A0A4R5CK30_9FLAO|nr:sialate O-acetylesterase [Flavobacterium cellulosilyticum]TDD99519.1 sialate O-acetylesterase [Flavobacterium cellulosilyticum]
MKRFKVLLLVLISVQSFTLLAQIKLPKLISNGLVLQRNEKIKIWGWAAPKEQIKLEFKSKTYTTSADVKGNWSILLPAQKAGGPYEMTLKASNQITLKDILFGDVWVCSGQSNMELQMERLKEKYFEEIKNSKNNEIRQFTVPDKYDFKSPQNDVDSGNWVAANPETVLEFSGVAYFFAKKIYEKEHIPIGLINSALGGSPVESWMSDEALKAFPNAYDEVQKFKNDQLIADIEASDKKRNDDWYALVNATDKGLADENQKWSQARFDDTNWSKMAIPGYWKDQSIGNVNGVVWFRKEIEIPESMAGKPAKLMLGRIVDQDFVYVNGEMVGTTGYQYPPRRYEVKLGILKPGKNTIAIRVINNSGNGGFVNDKPYYLAVANDTLDLKGEWRYKLGAEMKPLAGPTFIRWKPEGLYNAMIAPLLNLKIKGVIWYQGESNTGNPTGYTQLFTTMINDWRSKWNQGNFPFLYVQLANYMDHHPNPIESNWAALRQAQLESLRVPNTGMAVTIDIGEWNDIHPLNKEAVGNRLAFLARKLAYGDANVVELSPIPLSTEFKSDKVIVTFKNVDGGLIAKNGSELKSFAISNDGKNFVWANAKIVGKTVEVWNDKIDNPTNVRYAWDENPVEANLFSKERLPTTPFEVKKK